MPLVSAGQRITAGLLAEDYSQGDTSTITVTQAAATDITVAWSVPANDPQVNTCYKVTTMGNGTWGATQQVLNIQAKVGATATTISPQIGAAQFAASAAFRWKAVLTMLITATGTTGTYFAEIEVFASINSATWISTGTVSNATVAGTVSGTGQTINTTISNNVTIQAFWASTTGAPTLSSHGSIFEKLGG